MEKRSVEVVDSGRRREVATINISLLKVGFNKHKFQCCVLLTKEGISKIYKEHN